MVSSPAYDSTRLKNRSVSCRASAVSVLSSPSSTMYVGSWPSFSSASKISSRSCFSRFLRRLVAPRFFFSGSGVVSSSSPQLSYRTVIFSLLSIVLSGCPILLQKLLLLFQLLHKGGLAPHVCTNFPRVT